MSFSQVLERKKERKKERSNRAAYILRVERGGERGKETAREW